MNNGPTFTPREDLGGSPQVSPRLVLVGPLGLCLGGSSFLSVACRSTSTRGSHSVPSASLSVPANFLPMNQLSSTSNPLESLSLPLKNTNHQHIQKHIFLLLREPPVPSPLLLKARHWGAICMHWHHHTPSPAAWLFLLHSAVPDSPQSPEWQLSPTNPRTLLS